MWLNVYTDLLEKHAPLKEHLFTVRQDAPWYTREISDANRACKKAERQCRSTNLTIRKQLFNEAQSHVNHVIKHCKQEFYSSKVDTADQKSLIKIVDSLMNKPKYFIYLPMTFLRSWLTESVGFYTLRYPRSGPTTLTHLK